MKKDSGKTPIIYTTTAWWDSCTGDSSAFKADPLWIASYGVSVPSIPSVWGNLTFWQYSESATIAGIGGVVDQDSLSPHPGQPGQHDHPGRADPDPELAGGAEHTVRVHRHGPSARALDQRFRADNGEADGRWQLRGDGHSAGLRRPRLDVVPLECQRGHHAHGPGHHVRGRQARLTPGDRDRSGPERRRHPRAHRDRPAGGLCR